VLARRLPHLDARLAGPVRYAIEAGGKRLRPVLCLGAYRAAGGQPTPRELFEAASALELIHTYSLLHDDLPCMDDDDYRRGRPTAHRVYGETATTLAGSAMIPLAAAVLDEGAAALGLTPPERSAVVLDLARGAGAAGMVGGQVLDLAAERQPVDAAGLESIHSHKTGALFGASLRIGARLARSDEPVVEAFGRCGRALGLAFQVADDILDVTGRSETLGKSAGRDAEQGKATYPGLLGLEGARRRAAAAAADAVSALRDAGIHDDVLEGLIEFAVSRDR
jgi:geranylgeranyl diphosphate synthase type II